MTDAEVRATAGEDVAFISDDAQGHEFPAEFIGPAARTAIEAAAQTRECLWGIPNSGLAINVIVAELPAAARDTFVGELRASEFSESVAQGMPTFSWMSNEPAIARVYSWYGFTENVMVGALTPSEDGGVAAVALSRMQQLTAQP